MVDFFIKTVVTIDFFFKSYLINLLKLDIMIRNTPQMGSRDINHYCKGWGTKLVILVIPLQQKKCIYNMTLTTFKK